MSPQLALMVALLYLVHARTPSPSPSTSVTPTPTPTPSISPMMFYSQAPTHASGKALGLSGLETPEFKKRCKRCCRKSKKKFKHAIPSLRRCDKCKLKKNLHPGYSGQCRYGAPLGYAKTPEYCFFYRCHRMLIARGPCICYVL